MREVAERLGVALMRDETVAVEPGERRIRLRGGDAVPYDAAVIAVGARRVQSLGGAVGFGGPPDGGAVQAVIDGGHERVAIVVPPGAAWTLPGYEVALRAAAAGASTVVVTAEERPAEAFGAEASSAVAELLGTAGVQVLHAIVKESEPGSLFLQRGGAVTADAVIALPYLRGPRLEGLPADRDGFLPTDPHARVEGAENVFGAGDGTNFPIRQGAIAAQQAEVAARGIAALTGADVTAEPLKPVLRGALPAPDGTLFLEHDLAAGASRAATEPLWHPPYRVAGLRLPQFLDERPG